MRGDVIVEHWAGPDQYRISVRVSTGGFQSVCDERGQPINAACSHPDTKSVFEKYERGLLIFDEWHR